MSASATNFKPLLVRERDLPAITGFSKRAIRNAIARGCFPKPVRIGQRGVAWRVSDLEAWVQGGCGRVDALDEHRPARARH